MSDNKCYFEKGQYYFGYDFFANKQIPNEHLISVDNYVYAPLCDAAEAGLLYVLHDDKIGVFTLDSCGQGGYGYMLFSSNIYPFIYDEVWHNGDFCGDGVGYVAVRINHCWGVLRVEDTHAFNIKHSRRPCMMIIPCIYPTRETAISFLDRKLYHLEYKWRNPFQTDGHTLR